ncbi:DUF2142 domain-containing protein [Cryobacterium sp. PH31-AA6]|uniref:DUF2142 domain-containing protein n=1 Tax=Cryobacterium sp. PH31-AA6 TaxID=3046205 RepID=UPI0024B9D462|nr:DUF2142 domain-containing protein [Cryobacterium sp. PH31-AA6]MDJ0324896.1 DUF2142 domain-containing protein [Cryobacterium sp. PH31-AA6]
MFVVAFAALLAPMLLWALASPLMSVPDEPSHAIRAAAVVRGQIASIPWEKNPALTRADVPKYVAHAHELTCYAFRPDISAGCMRPVQGNPIETVTTGTSAGLNSPVYYALVGLPTLVIQGTPALYAMRGVNAVLCAAALAIMIMQLLQLPRSRWVLLTTFVSVTPMVLYLGGSMNPNGLEIAAAGALFATLVVTARTRASRRILWERAALVAVSAGLLMSTRSIALLWVLIIIGVALLFADRRVVLDLLRSSAAWVAIAVSAIAGALTVLWYLTPSTFAEQPNAGVGTTPTVEFFTMFFRTLDFSDGLVGFFGWVDTPSPAFSVIVWSFAVVGALVAAVAWGSRRGRLAVLVLALVMVLVPALTQTILISTVGNIWQGRYMLAMFVCLMVVAGLAIDDSDQAPTVSIQLRRFTIAALVLVSTGQVFSFVSTLRRYVVSVNGDIEALFNTPQWQPPLGWIALMVLLALSVAAAAVLTYREAMNAEHRLEMERPHIGSPIPATSEPLNGSKASR